MLRSYAHIDARELTQLVVLRARDPAVRGGEPPLVWWSAPLFGLAAGSCNERGDDVGGVPVKGPTGTVVAHRRPRISMGCCFLDVPQRNTSVDGGGDAGAASVWYVTGGSLGSTDTICLVE